MSNGTLKSGLALSASLQLNLLADAAKKGGDKAKEALARKMAKDVLELEGVDSATARNFTGAFESALGIARESRSATAAAPADCAVGAVIQVGANGAVHLVAGAAQPLPQQPPPQQPPEGRCEKPRRLGMAVLAEGTKIEMTKKFGQLEKGTIAKIGTYDVINKTYHIFVKSPGTAKFDKLLPGKYQWSRTAMRVVSNDA